MENKKVQVEVHFIKTEDFITHHASGFFGGFTSNDKLHVTYFTERVPLPKSQQLEVFVDDTGKSIGPPKETNRVSKTGIIRECQGGLIMDIDTAKGLKDWLTSKIDEFENLKLAKL